jgi:cell division septation protein DedD
VAELERRLTKRKILERLTYIDMPGGNGGVVTDVSEGGLGFHVASPLGKMGTVHFLLSGNANRISGTGSIVWTDARGKTGGLLFTEFPDEIREQIRSWPFRTNLRLESAGGAGELPVDFGLLNTAELADGAAGESYYRQYFPEYAPAEAPAGKRSRFLKAIRISGLAGMVGVLSYFCYREARKWEANSKTSSPPQHSSETILPGTVSNSASEIALLRDTSERSDVGSETLPRLAAEANAAGPLPGSSEAQSVPPEIPVQHQEAEVGPEILFVQVGAVTQEADAYKLLNELRQRNFAAFISPPVSDGFYRVQLGPYQTPEAARDSLKALEEAGYKPFIRR